MRKLHLIIFILFFFVGCQYVEQDTPPGQVAPPAEQASSQPYRPSVDTGAPPIDTKESYDRPSKFDAGSIIPRFERVYQSVGSPRLAIFFNRSLSNEVREWKTQSRLSVSAEGNYTRKDENSTKTWKGYRGIAVQGQQHMEDPGRIAPENESWMWEFEDGFLNPFIDAHAKIIDRATIMRLSAASSGKQGSTLDPITVKKIEMDALVEKAELYIELLVRKEPKSSVGYAFKASAKEVKTGIIRANVTSLEWDYKRKPTDKVITTKSGYQFVPDDDNSESELPEISVVSKDLALGLMRSLSNSWEE